MVRLTIGLVLVLALFTISYAVQKRDRNDYSKNPHKIVCYFGSWANYHKAEPFKIEDVDTEMCTHVVYGFAKLDEYNYTIREFDPYLETDEHPWDLRAYNRFNGLRKNNPALTTMIAIGGWYEGSEKYSDMAKDTTIRKRFVNSVVEFLKKYDFDGLDVDWEYPGIRKGNPTVDPENFITLLTELKEAFEPEGFLLTAAISPGKPNIDIAYKDHIPKINDLLDWANVMTYDYHGGWEDFLGHNAPLYNRPDEVVQKDANDLHPFFNVNYTVHYLLGKGLKKEKFVMGVPFYGRAWTLEDKTKVKLNDPVKGMSPAGFISGEEGVLGYNEICQFEMKNPGQWHNSYDPWYRAPYAYNDSIWVGFDNQESLSCKIAFLKEMGLSGGMVWSLETDDFKNRCGGGRYPLLHRVHSMLNGDKKNSFECNLGDVPTTAPTTPTTPTTTPTTPTTTPTTPTTTPTTPTTTPTTPTTTPTTPTTTPTTPTTTPTTPPTTPTTPRPTTTEPTTTTTTAKPTPTTQKTETASAMVTKEIDGHIVRCYKVGYIEHPTDVHKYVVCEFISSGPSKGWWIHIMGCAPGTKWAQAKTECILDD